MNLSPERIVQQVQEELDGAAHFLTIARPLLAGMLTVMKQQRIEIARLTTENAKLRAEMQAEREKLARIAS